jgi:hypothetical protein
VCKPELHQTRIGESDSDRYPLHCEESAIVTRPSVSDPDHRQRKGTAIKSLRLFVSFLPDPKRSGTTADEEGFPEKRQRERLRP